MDIDITADSRDFIHNLNRSAMGVFASRRLALLRAHKLSMYTLLRDSLDRRVSAGDASESSRTELDILNRLTDLARKSFASECSGVQREMITAELFHWWSICGDSMMMAAARIQDASESSVKVTSIIDNPDMHEYFSAGIWDVAFIDECLTNGVDVELARSALQH